MKPPLAPTSLAITSLLLVTACGDSAGDDAGDSTPTEEEVAPGFISVADEDFEGGGELVVQIDYDTDEEGGLDPQLADTARSWTIESLVYETLVTTDENLEPQPGLATSWETPDDTTYVFTLSDDATFSNGRAMTTDDVVGSLERLADSAGVWASQIGPVDSIEATGDHEVTVTLTEPYPPFLAALANTPAAVLPMEEIDSGSVDVTEEMLGTGPFVVDDRRQDEYWEFSPNEHYSDDLGVSSLRLDIVTEESTRAAGLRDGSADLSVFSSVDSIDALQGDENIHMAAQQNTDFHYLMVNSKSATSELADQDVRFAINSAIDREAISELAMGGQSEPTGVTPAPLPGACAPADLPSAEANLEQARGVVDEVGGLELDLLVYTSEPILADIAQVIQQNLAEIGVTVSIQQYDYGTYSEHVYTSDPADFDLALSWFAGYADPAMVTGWWNTEEAGFTSTFMEENNEINTLIDQGRSESDEDARAEALTELCSVADSDSQMVPLVLRTSVLGFNTDTVSPTLYSSEGYGNFLRAITEFQAE